MKNEIFNIKKIGEISSFKVIVGGSHKDDFKGKVILECKVPSDFPSGDHHEIIINCINCFNDFSINAKSKNGFAIKKSMDLLDNHKVIGFENLGNFLELASKFEKDELGNYIFYNFSFTGKYKSVADIAGFNCPHCQAKYMMSFACYEGENEKKPEPDIIYIDKILQVEADFEKVKGMF